jgi:hypothetical protein
MNHVFLIVPEDLKEVPPAVAVREMLRRHAELLEPIPERLLSAGTSDARQLPSEPVRLPRPKYGGPEAPERVSRAEEKRRRRRERNQSNDRRRP